jgi:hypothetical protein
MDHALSEARRRAVLAIAQQQALVRQELEKQMGELNQAMNELRDLFVNAAKLEGDGWAFAQNAVNEIVLRQVEKVEQEVLADVGPGPETQANEEA